MEYEIKATIVPAEQEATYYFRVFVIARHEDRHAGTRCILQKRIMLIDPHDESPAQIWAILAIRNLLDAMDRDLTEEVSVGKATLMRELSEHEIILRVAGRRFTP